MSRRIDGGRFAAVVSSGSGRTTHDRVTCFVPTFDTSDRAARFVTEQALAWIARPGRPADFSTPTQE